MDRALTHPEVALYPDGDRALPSIPACHHYAGNAKFIGKALDLQQRLGPIFDITCDCEDGAKTGDEVSHAEMVSAMLCDPRNAFKRVGVRIHDPSSLHWQTDVDIVVGRAAYRLGYVFVPKVRSRSELEEIRERVNSVAGSAGVHAPIPIHALIETHEGLQNVAGIASTPQLEVLEFGLLDFVSAHHGAIPATAMRSPGQFEHPLIVRAKCEIVAAALGQNVVPSHNVIADFSDAEGLSQSVVRARDEFGFLRIPSIHPNQISVILGAMRSSAQLLKQASEILVAAQDQDWGPVQHLGQMEDRASYRYYWTLLHRAKRAGTVIPEEADRRFF